jgi:hypothetical protein
MRNLEKLFIAIEREIEEKANVKGRAYWLKG